MDRKVIYNNDLVFLQLSVQYSIDSNKLAQGNVFLIREFKTLKNIAYEKISTFIICNDLWTYSG
jgi:hypothetical protein